MQVGNIKKKWWIAGIILFVFVGGFLYLMSPLKPEAKNPFPMPDVNIVDELFYYRGSAGEPFAIFTTENIIKGRLHNPDTAEFIDTKEYDIVMVDDFTYCINGHVESKNRLGWTYRTYFQVTHRELPRGRYKLLDIKLKNEYF